MLLRPPRTPTRPRAGAAPPTAAAAPGDDDPDPLRPCALALNAKLLSDELERRGLRVTGFSGEDAQRLQVELDAEYDAEQALRVEARAARVELRRAEEAATQRAR